ncbi:hypothetical protein [Curvibacter lanceolatus]|nr:hypothetical protein [Curvibacter lanceolatus]
MSKLQKLNDYFALESSNAAMDDLAFFICCLTYPCALLPIIAGS